MAANIQSFKSIQEKNDPWEDALEAFGKQYEIFNVKHIQPIDEVMGPVDKVKYFSHVPVHTPNYTTHNLVLSNKHREVVQVFKDVELQDGKICVKKQLAQPSRWPWSWVNWMWRPRTQPPAVNVNASFNNAKRKP
jgi:hypothetical protein